MRGGGVFRFGNIFLFLLSFWGHLILPGIKCWRWGPNVVAERDLSCFKSSLLFFPLSWLPTEPSPLHPKLREGQGGGAFPARNQWVRKTNPITKKGERQMPSHSNMCHHSRQPSVRSGSQHYSQKVAQMFIGFNLWRAMAFGKVTIYLFIYFFWETCGTELLESPSGTFHIAMSWFGSCLSSWIGTMKSEPCHFRETEKDSGLLVRREATMI